MEDDRIRVLEGDAVPPALRALDRCCRRLYVIGDLPPPTLPRVAMVGSRSPSPGGRRTAYEIARGLARAGVVVVSGLARGIDAASHRGALDGGGITVAFLGSGADVIYPKSSRDLAAAIPARGALVSEYPLGSAPVPWRFVERNRLVAAYTAGTLVVEAGPRSGALITAGLAAEFGRELWAVPGDPVRPGTRGSNCLLRDGAGVVLDALDVLAGLGLAGSPDPDLDRPAGPPPGLSPAEASVWRALARGGTADPEALTRRTGLAAAALMETLSVLELAGHVERNEEGYTLAPRPGPR
jgi:DNA processing protein